MFLFSVTKVDKYNLIFLQILVKSQKDKNLESNYYIHTIYRRTESNTYQSIGK
jgi:hypothetical protein